VSHKLHPWKGRQLLLAQEEVRRFLSAERKSREKTEEASLRVKLFEILSDHLKRRVIGEEVLPLTDRDVNGGLYAISNETYLTMSEKERKKLQARRRGKKSDLKDSLERFAAVDRNKRMPASFRLKDGAWTLEGTFHDCAMKAFWEPYFTECESVTIAYGENVFFRGGKDLRAFVRHMDVNTKEDLEKIHDKCGLPLGWAQMQGGTQFVSAGDCAAIIELARRFECNGVHTDIQTARKFLSAGFSRGDEKTGLIVVGNGRTFPWLADRLAKEGFPYRLDDDGIVDTRATGTKHLDNFSPGNHVRGIIARTFSEDLGCWLTIIASNHGRCSEAWVQYVLSEKNIERLFEKYSWIPDKSIPNRFQIIVDVPVDSTEIINLEPGSILSLVDYVGPTF